MTKPKKKKYVWRAYINAKKERKKKLTLAFHIIRDIFENYWRNLNGVHALIS
jgi:hypothetical protein